MGYLLDVKWDEGRGLEDLMIWGTGRLFKFIDIFDQEYAKNDNGKENEFAVFLYYEMKNILMDMEAVINRFMGEMEKAESKKLGKIKEILEPETSEE